MRHPIRWCILMLALCCWVSPALGQGLSPRPGAGLGQQPQKTETKTGPAEAAPEKEDIEDLPELPPTPIWPGQEAKKAQFFELHGYFRFRGDLFVNGNLGQPDSANLRAPFYTPLSESSNLSCANRVGKPMPSGDERSLTADDCPTSTLSSANIRLRIEPTIRPLGSEWVTIKAQFDIFDNLVMGSTPNGFLGEANRAPHVPLTAFSDTQVAPIAGRNTRTPAIVVKRAWAEIRTPFGELKVGRMPSQWGMGLIANDGSCWDCNYGDNADRIMFATKVFKHTFAFGYDWASTGPTSLSVNGGLPYYDGQAIDLENLDDVDQLVWVAGRIDKPEVNQERVENGELVLNYGLYMVWRRQAFDYSMNYMGISSGDLANNFLERRGWALIPDLWFKLMWKDFYLEFEGAIIAGHIDNAGNDDGTDPLEILQFGWVLRSHYKFLNKQLKIGLEVGMASGDQAEPGNSDYNRRRILTLQDPNTKDGALNEFRFDYDYHVDLILFRELLGTVSNAIYFKPTVAYDIIPQTFGAQLDLIYSAAHRPVAFPGNSPHLGVELDFSLYYKNPQDGFFAGLQYGVLFPLGGLDRPAEIYGAEDGCTNGEGPGCAGIAHTLQAHIVVQF